MGKKRGPRTKPKKGWTAYTRTGDVTQCPVAVASLDDVRYAVRGHRDISKESKAAKANQVTSIPSFTEPDSTRSDST